MPHVKKPRLAGMAAVLLPPRRSRRIAGRPNAAFDDLGVDVFVKIYEFLGPIDILRSRVCRKMSKAAKRTIVPPTEFPVHSIEKFHAMRAMTRALPNLQQISLRYIFNILDGGHRFVDGEDPNEERTTAFMDNAHDIAILSNFRKLRVLDIQDTSLNGRYPFLFNFPLLQSLTIKHCSNLKWDLAVLAGLPLLEDLDISYNDSLTGNINSLRVLKVTLKNVMISDCQLVEGNFMDLANFPHLKELDLIDTAVTGDIRKIEDTDFLKLEKLALPDSVYGGNEYEFHRVSDVPEVMHSIHRLRKRFLGFGEGWSWSLSKQSPDFFQSHPHIRDIDQPFFVTLVQVGSRLGWTWEDDSSDQYCEINWLDPEPDRESSDYEEYIQKLQAIQEKIDLFRGFHQPPTEEQYYRLMY